MTHSCTTPSPRSSTVCAASSAISVPSDSKAPPSMSTGGPTPSKSSPPSRHGKRRGSTRAISTRFSQPFANASSGACASPTPSLQPFARATPEFRARVDELLRRTRAAPPARFTRSPPQHRCRQRPGAQPHPPLHHPVQPRRRPRRHHPLLHRRNAIGRARENDESLLNLAAQIGSKHQQQN